MNGDSNETASGGTGDKQSAQPPNSEALFASDQFRMFAYKILPCAKRTSHEWTTCPFAHPGEKARRRDPRVYNYLAIPCEATKQGGTCPRGDECPNCHSLFEYWLHPSRYRTQLCRDMEGGHCKRQVCFFAHSIEELRVPDHSHLTIPPEMQQQAGASTASTSTAASTDACATDSSSRSSTPRASNKAGGGAASKSASPQAGSPAAVSRSRAVNIRNTATKHGKAPRHSSHSPLLHSPSSASAGSAGGVQWAGFAATPAAAAMMNNGGGATGSTNAAELLAPSYVSAPTLEQQYALLQQRQRQMQQAGVLSPSGSMYEQQLQMLLAPESRQAQQAQHLLVLQQRQQAAAWSAQMSSSSLPSYGDGTGLQGASPPLSPVPPGLLQPTASYGAADKRLFVPPSASSGALSAMAAAAAGWQPAALLRTFSTPAANSLVRHSSGITGTAASHFANAGGQVQPSVSCVSASSTVSDGQDVTLASLLGCSSPGSNWPGGAGVTPQGSLGGEGLGLGYGQDAQQMGGMLAGNGGGLHAAGLMLLQQQQQQQLAAINGAAGMLQSFNSGALADCNGQVLNDVIGMMMHQLLLQQPSVAV